MKKNLLIAIPIEIIITGVTGLILNNDKMETSIIILFIGLFVVLTTIGYFSLIEKLGKFSRSVIDNIHAQANLNQSMLSKSENADVREEYLQVLEVIRKYRPYKKQVLDGLYIFDPKNPHKISIINHEHNRDNK